MRGDGVFLAKTKCSGCGAEMEFQAVVNLESGPCPYDIEQYEHQSCDACIEAANRATDAIWARFEAGELSRQSALELIFGEPEVGR